MERKRMKIKKDYSHLYNAEKGPRTNPAEKAKANPKSFRLAINAMCFDCQGGGSQKKWRKFIKECQIDSCPLYFLRPFQSKDKKEEV